MERDTKTTAPTAPTAPTTPTASGASSSTRSPALEARSPPPANMPAPLLPQTMTSAQLQVVQPGSRKSFRRRVIDAMRAVVAADGAFFCFGTEDALAYLDGSRVIDGVAVPLRALRGTRLTQAFGFEVKSVVTSTRRAYLAEELYPEDERRKLPYFRDNSSVPALQYAIVVFLHEGGVLFGIAGLERRLGAGPFAADDARRLEELAPFIVAGARSQIAYDERSREAVAVRALAKVTGSLYVIDRDRKCVIWAADRQRGLTWDDDVAPYEAAIVDAAELLLAARARGEALPTPPRLPGGTVAAVAKIEVDPVFGNTRSAVLRLEPVRDVERHDAPKAAHLLEGLSKREREIARLLVAGYSGVNVAAIVGLSENTVRTYVRRLYQKLDVANRADLVRKLISPDPKSMSPSSQIAPPPDSSLLDGDDTLD